MSGFSSQRPSLSTDAARQAWAAESAAGAAAQEEYAAQQAQQHAQRRGGAPQAQRQGFGAGYGQGGNGGGNGGYGGQGAPGQGGYGQGPGGAPWGPPQRGGQPMDAGPAPQAQPSRIPTGGRPGFVAPGTQPQGGSGGYSTQRHGGPGAPGSQGLPARRPAPGYDPAYERAPAEYQDGAHSGGRRFAGAMGIPSAMGPAPRRKGFKPFDIGCLEAVAKDEVRLWKELERGFPAYFRMKELEEACTGFLRSLLSPEEEAGRTLQVEVKKRDDGSVQVKDVTAPEVTFGTHAANTVQVSGAAVSRRHARLVIDERGVQLVDQGSSNGTWVRGERLQPGYAYPLKSGEAFTIPGYEVHVRFAEKAQAAKLHGITLANVRLEQASRLAESVPTHAVVAIVRMEPAGLRLFVEIDLPLASLIVARVIGAPAASATGAKLGVALKDGPPPVRPLSEVEKGVLELVLVKLLDAAQSRWGAEAELTLHLEHLVDGKDPRVARTAAGIQRCIVATAALAFDGRKDACRIALPDATLAGLAPRFARAVERAGEHPLEVVERFRDLTQLAEVELSARVGKSMLTRRDLMACVPGDVFVPDELTIEAKEGALKGRVKLQAVKGRGRASVLCELAEFSAERILVEVASCVVASGGRAEAKRVPGEDEVQYEGEGGGEAGAEGEPQDAAQDGGEGAPEGGDEGAPGAALLDDVPLPLVVELGRVSLTVRELAGLRKGQVLEIGHDPKDPVSLVYEGHVIGAGKLVNVEGEIGVQITSLGR